MRVRVERVHETSCVRIRPPFDPPHGSPDDGDGSRGREALAFGPDQVEPVRHLRRVEDEAAGGCGLHRSREEHAAAEDVEERHPEKREHTPSWRHGFMLRFTYAHLRAEKTAFVVSGTTSILPYQQGIPYFLASPHA